MSNFSHSILTFFSKSILKKYNPDIVAITGGMEATDIKEACFCVLKKKYSVRKSERNYNTDKSPRSSGRAREGFTELDIPLAIIGGVLYKRSLFNFLKILVKALLLIFVRSKDYPEILILEFKGDMPKSIASFMFYIKPHIGIISSIPKADLKQFGTLQKAIAEKRLIYTHTRANGFIVVNNDDDLVVKAAKKSQARVITYSILQKETDIHLEEIRIISLDKEQGLSFKLMYEGSVTPIFLRNILAEPYIYNALCAICVGIAYKLTPLEIAQSLLDWQPRIREV